MEEKNILDIIRYKINNNEEITSEEIIELKDKSNESFKNNWWLIILLLFMCNCKFSKKEDDK